MARWGEEESKTKGLGSFFLWLGIAGVICYALFINMESITLRMNLEKAMQDTIRAALGKEETELRAQIAEAAEDLGIDLHPGDIELTVELNKDGNWDVYCRIPYTLEVNLFISKHTVSLPIKEELTIVPM